MDFFAISAAESDKRDFDVAQAIRSIEFGFTLMKDVIKFHGQMTKKSKILGCKWIPAVKETMVPKLACNAPFQMKIIVSSCAQALQVFWIHGMLNCGSLPTIVE